MNNNKSILDFLKFISCKGAPQAPFSLAPKTQKVLKNGLVSEKKYFIFSMLRGRGGGSRPEKGQK